MKNAIILSMAMLVAGCAGSPPPGPQAATTPQTPAEIVVEKQLVAYNNHDAEAMMATFAPDIRIYMHPNDLQHSGLEDVGKWYARFFAKVPTAHAVAKRRITHGNFVIDDEIATGLPGGKEVNVITIYEVRDQRIVAVWFIQ